MELDKEVAVHQKQSNAMVERAETMEITSPELMEEATEILSQANKALDAAGKKKDEVMRPALDVVAAERKRWKPLEDILKGVVNSLRGKMSVYQTEALKKKEAEDAKIAARVKEGKGNLKPETAIKKMEEGQVEKKVETDSGSVGFKAKKQLKIVDESKVPREFLIVDEKAVFEALTSGNPVAGCEIEIIQVPINRR